jgi:hypothetical protein
MLSPKVIFSLLIFILVFHVLATIYSWYWTYLWLDMPMHFLGGFWVAMAAVALIFNFQFPISKESVNQKFFRLTIVILSFVVLIGVFWEFFEFFYDMFISSRGYSGFLQLGAADTLSDLFFDLLGGAAFLVLHRLFFKM